MNDNYVNVTDLNVLLENLIEEISELPIVDIVYLYNGEFSSEDDNDLKFNLSEEKAAVLVDLTNAIFDENYDVTNAEVFINLYILAANDNRVYDKRMKYNSTVCLEAGQNIKRKIGSSFLNCELNDYPSFSSIDKFLNLKSEENYYSAYVLRCSINLIFERRIEPT